MGATETSRQAYSTLDKLGLRQRTVYKQIEAMEKDPRHTDLPSNADVAKALNLPINQVTPRTLELRKAGFVKVQGVKKDRVTGKTVQTLCTANPNDNRLMELVEETEEPQYAAVSWLND